MSTNSVDLFSYLPGLEVTANELLEAELLCSQILQANFPDLDLRQGTGLYDTVIRPSATLLALTNKAVVFYFQNNDISGVDDTTPQVFVDKMLSNFFVTRLQGNKAIINARLYFARSKSISISSDVFFSPDNSLKYFPATSLSYTASQLTYDSSSNEYFIDVDLTAENAGLTYNVTSGSLIYFSSFDPYFLHAEINYLKQTAEDVESNTQFIARTQTAISTRNLINVPSISSNILANFSLVSGVSTFGYGDVEMIRDQVKVVVPGVSNPIWIHIGGKVDVFSRVPIASSIVQFITDSSGNVTLTGSIYEFQRSSLSGGALPDTVDQYVSISVTSVTRSGTTAIVTTTSPHGYTSGQVILTEGADQSQYNLSTTITVTGANTYTYPLVDNTAVTPATGTITSNSILPYTWVNSYWINQPITSLTQTGGVATATSSNHGLTLGERVNISGATQPEYNQVAIVTGIPTKDTFTYSVLSSAVSPATGSINMQFNDRSNEVGFSDRQQIVVSFGTGQANKTISLVLYFHQNLDGLQTYLEEAANRVLCADLLARGFNLTMLDISITGYNGSAPDASIASTQAIAYLASLSPGQPFIMADLVSLLYSQGIQTIQTPLLVTYNKYWNDLFANTTGTITDVLNPNDAKNIFLLNSLVTTSAIIS